ncbi:hypothetical protein [uncultured Amnibacterium sp.]|uniref:hypothetical protein n=1 Tax=uncultured Amnibacterium sp. TaxID=1631851 RepID=UPI0035CC4F76
MSVLNIRSGMRLRSTAMPFLPKQQQSYPTPMLDWNTTSDGVWSARIGLDTAGSIERIDAGFQVRDWEGSVEGVYPTLRQAQRSLEPSVRAAARAARDGIERRANLLASSTLALGLIAVPTLAAAWFSANPL